MIDPGTTSYNQFWAVSKIDGKTVLGFGCASLWPVNVTECLEPISLTSGKHDIQIEANTNGKHLTTITNTQFNAEPGANYEIQGKFLFDQNSVSMSSWIINMANNTLVTPRLSSLFSSTTPIPVVINR